MRNETNDTCRESGLVETPTVSGRDGKPAERDV